MTGTGLSIWPQDVRVSNGYLVASALFELYGVENRTLWYRLPEEHMGDLHPACDPFVVGGIYLGMQAGCDVHVHGQVSPSLLHNLAEFQAAWAAFVPGLTRVEIRAEREEEPCLPRHRSTALVAFSGGVDSSFTAFRHARAVGTRFPRQVAAGLMVHGFDIPLYEPEAFSSASERSRAMLHSLGLDLIPMATNYRDLVADWTHSYGAAIASCMMLLASRFREGLIGQGLAYSHFAFLSEGSNPLTDALLSSDAFTVVPDGAGYQRADKVLMMSKWPELLTSLRVCWAGPRKDRNCCECEKCVRNILTFRVLGLGLPPCFEKDVSNQQISRLSHLNEIKMVTQYDNIVALAARKGLTDPWVRVLRRRLASRRRLTRSRIRQWLARLPYYAGRVRARVALLGRLVRRPRAAAGD